MSNRRSLAALLAFLLALIPGDVFGRRAPAA